jgi:hypothetical protein
MYLSQTARRKDSVERADVQPEREPSGGGQGAMRTEGGEFNAKTQQPGVSAPQFALQLRLGHVLSIGPGLRRHVRPAAGILN